MANIRQVLDAVVELASESTGKQLQLAGVATRDDYETIRTRLVKLWSERREILLAIGGEGSDPLLELSLCGTYHADAQSASFFLGKARRKQPRQFSFEIVDVGAMPATASPIGSVASGLETPESAVNDDEFPDLPHATS